MPSLLPSLFFCSDIRHSHDLSAALRDRGVRVYPVSGETHDREEARLYRLFAAGEIDGLASCGVLQEGFDAPNAIGAFLCRPTKSGLLYRQMVGRVLRPHPAPQGDRPYQGEFLASILEHLLRGITLQLGVLPTGCGKTYVAAHVPDIIRQWKGRRMKRLLFLVHRDNLVQQAAKAFEQWTSLSVGIEAGGGRYAGDADVVVASVQSLGAGTKILDGGDCGLLTAYNDRIKRLNPDHFDAVICDEVHHAIKAVTYHNVFRYFGVLKKDEDFTPDRLLLGITATPNRSDNVGAEVICDAIVYNYPINDAIEGGWLARPHAWRVETEVDISNVATNRGDFNVGQLERTINTPERNAMVAREYLKIRDQVAPDVMSKGGHKPYACVVDFVDIAGRHSLITLPTLFGLRVKFDSKGGDVVEQAAAVEKVKQEHPGLNLEDVTDIDGVKRRLEQMKSSLHRLDLLRPPQAPAELRTIAKFSWLQDQPGSYHLGLISGGMLSVRENTLGQFEISRHFKGIKTPIGAERDIKAAIEAAEKQVPAEDRKVMNNDAAWRKEPPTEKQCFKLMGLLRKSPQPNDRKLAADFKTPAALYGFALIRHRAGDPAYSRGELSRRIDSLSVVNH